MICFAASHTFSPISILTLVPAARLSVAIFPALHLSVGKPLMYVVWQYGMALAAGTGYHLSLDLPVCDATKSCRLSLAQLADCAGSCSWRELPVRSVAALKCCRLVVVDQAADQAYNLNPLFLYPPSLIPYVFRSSGP